MKPPAQPLTKDRIQQLLDLLTEELSQDPNPHHVVIVGGAAMALSYYPAEEPRMSTADVDAAYARMDDVNSAANRIADAQTDIERGWLNDACKNYVPEGDLEVLREVSPSRRLCRECRWPASHVGYESSSGGAVVEIGDAARRQRAATGARRWGPAGGFECRESAGRVQ